MASPSFVDERLGLPANGPESPHPGPAAADGPDRVRKLEDEVFALRDTMARFAELVLGEIKQIKQPGEAHSAAPGAVPVPELPIPGVEILRRPWLLIELFRDIATTFRMYLDPRYRVRRSTQLVVPIILGLFALNYLFFNWVFALPVVNTVLEKACDIILAVLLYKVISREMVRYREALVQYAAWEAVRANLPHGRVLHSDAEAPHTQLDTE